VELILGPVEGLAAATNSGRSMQDLSAEIVAHLDARREAGDTGLLIFIDDRGGSCANAAQLARGHGLPLRILTGVNLAMLLDYVTWRDSMGLKELPRRLVERGRDAVSELPPPHEE
jgi:mannose/fructose-specific phosphotransferase system component IIA